MSSSQVWLAYALLSAIFAGLTAVLAKAGLEGVDSDYALLLRTLLVACLLLPLVIITGKWSNPLHLPARPLTFIALSAVATGASWLFYFRALQLGDVTQIASIDKLSLAFAVIFAVALLGERPNVRDWIGIVLVSAGAVLIAAKH